MYDRASFLFDDGNLLLFQPFYGYMNDGMGISLGCGRGLRAVMVFRGFLMDV